MRMAEGTDPVPVVWFRAPAGAAFYDGPTPFRSRNYTQWHENDGLGEQEGPPDPCCQRRPTKGRNCNPPAPYRGREVCGSAAAWRGEPVPDSEWFMTNIIGQAPCCASDPLLAGTGGSAEGGEWAEGFAAAAWTGGSAEGGMGGVVPPDFHIVGGAGGEGGGHVIEATAVVESGGGGSEGGGSAAAADAQAVPAQGGGEGGGSVQAGMAVVVAGGAGAEGGGVAGRALAEAAAGGEGSEGGGAAGVTDAVAVEGDGGGEGGGAAARAAAAVAEGEGGGEGGGSAAFTAGGGAAGSGGGEGGGSAAWSIFSTSPPCSTTDTYTVNLPAIMGAFPCNLAAGVYTMANIGGQQWQATNGTWTVTLDLGVYPYTLTFTSFAGSAIFNATGFTCQTGAVFTFVLSSACAGWPAVQAVTFP